MLGGVFALALLVMKTEHYKEKTPLFCYLINIGVIIGYMAAIVTLPQPTDNLCGAFPWLVGIAFTLIYGCLFLKTWRIYWILRASKKMLKTNLTNWYICRLIGAYFLFEVIYLVIWTLVEPLHAEKVNVVNNQQQYQCTSDHWGIFWGVFLGYKMLWMIFGACMAIRARFIFDKINESKPIYYCIYNAVTVLIVGIPLIAALNNIPYALVILEVVIILLICTFTLVALFFNVWMEILVGEEDEFITGLRKRNIGPIVRPIVGMTVTTDQTDSGFPKSGAEFSTST